jgi:hypothetical protein
LDDLDWATSTNEQAVASTPDNHLNRGLHLDNLGNALESRFERTGSMDDLNQSISTREQAVACTPDNYPTRVIHLKNLGNALQARFERTGSMDDLDRAITTKEQAFVTDTAPSSIRLKAAAYIKQCMI